MKKLLLVLLLITTVTYSQSNSDIKSYAVKYLTESIIQFKGQEVFPFELEFLNKSFEPKELNLFYYSVEKTNNQGVLLCFINRFWTKESPRIVNKYTFYNLNLKKFQQFLNKLINIENAWGKNEWDKNLSFKFDDLTIVIHKRKSKMNSKLTLYLREFDSEWSHHRIRKTKEQLKQLVIESRNK
ncbi:hypothetical protein N8451_07865 [Polaribacter sp.]|nr:hypothetical protein [Polaribacter sp.]